MNVKRTLLLASTALTAIVLIAPATASGLGTWTDKGKKIETGDKTIQLTGFLGFEDSLGTTTFECDVEAEATLTESWGGGTGIKTGTGHVDKLTYLTETCVGTGFLANCKTVSEQITGLPWMLTATKEKDIEVTGEMTIHFDFEGCMVSEAHIEQAQITLDLDVPLAFTHMEITGQPDAPSFDLLSGEKAYGTLAVTGEDAGRFGVH